MVFIPIDNVGSAGVNKERQPHELPPEVWSDSRNIRFANGAAKKFLGEQDLLTNSTIIPWKMFPVRTGNINYWVYFSDAKARAFVGRGAADADITRTASDYNANPEVALWNGGVMNGVPVFNNGIDAPQLWDGVSLGSPLVDLPNLPTNYTARVVRPFKNFLVALDINKGGPAFPHLVLWSHSADPGTVPTSWDVADPTTDAGEVPLDDDGDFFIDMKRLGEVNVIYKERATWGMREVQSSAIFRFYKILEESGLLAQDCAANFKGRQFAVTDDDIIIHDGTPNAVSVIDKSVRRWLFSQIDTSYFGRSVVVPRYDEKEMWFCFPENGSSYLTLALVWSWIDGSIAFRELPADCRSIQAGPLGLATEDDTWDSGPALDWDEENLVVWDPRTLNTFRDAILIGRETAPQIVETGQTYQFQTTNYRSYLERTGLAIVRQGRDGQPRVDMERIKFLKAIHPRIVAAKGTVIDVYAGFQMNPNDDIYWDGPHRFEVGVDDKVDVYGSARLIGVRFEETKDVAWDLQGYSLELEAGGVY